MTYGFQVYSSLGNGGLWHEIGPMQGGPFRFATRKEAENMARICYGDDQIRIVEFAEVEN